MHEKILKEFEKLLAGMEKAGKNCHLVSSTGLQREEDPNTGTVTLSFAVVLDFTKGPEPEAEAKVVKHRHAKHAGPEQPEEKTEMSDAKPDTE